MSLSLVYVFGGGYCCYCFRYCCSLASWKEHRHECPNEFSIRDVLLVPIRRQIRFLRSWSRHASMFKVRMHTMRHAMPLLALGLVLQSCGCVVQRLSSNTQVTFAHQLSLESVPAVITNRFALRLLGQLADGFSFLPLLYVITASLAGTSSRFMGLRQHKYTPTGHGVRVRPEGNCKRGMRTALPLLVPLAQDAAESVSAS